MRRRGSMGNWKSGGERKEEIVSVESEVGNEH